MRQLRQELDRFWKWAKMSPLEYSKEIGGGEWETEYLHWDSIYSCVEYEISEIEKIGQVSSIPDILEAMAIDNECENILDMLEENNKVSQLIINKYSTYCQPKARWQIAELIKRVPIESGKDSLIQMIIKDHDKYVQRRALLSLDYLSHDEAKKYASLKINDEDKYLKMVCENILSY